MKVERCDEEAKSKCLHVPIHKATERSAHYTRANTVISNINNIRKMSIEKTHGPEEIARKKGKFTSVYNVTLLYSNML
jgi:hypothetical protein